MMKATDRMIVAAAIMFSSLAFFAGCSTTGDAAKTECCGSCQGAAVKESGTHFAAENLKAALDCGELPGAISVFYNNGIQETACLGYADARVKRPMTMDSMFMQCSQTKGFCGVTVAKLVEEGKLNLDDPVSKYLPEFATLWIKKTNEDGTITLVKA